MIKLLKRVSQNSFRHHDLDLSGEVIYDCERNQEIASVSARGGSLAMTGLLRLGLPLSFLIIFISFSVRAQSSTNFEVFKILVDSSVSQAIAQIPSSQKNVNLNLTLGNSYKIFEDGIIRSIQSHDKNVNLVNNDSEDIRLSYSIESAIVEYDEIYRDGLLGDYLTERKITVSGSYRIKNEDLMIRDFSIEKADTVKVDDIPSLENASYPFTKGQLPPEPFLSSLFEPIVAITTAAVVIALFFTVRSK